MTFRNKLGLWTLTALVVGNMVGSGVYMLPRSLAPYGKWGALAWVLAALCGFLLALVFSRLSVLVPRNGGLYVFTQLGFGEYIGFQTAFTYSVAIWAGNAVSALAVTGYLPVLFPALKDWSLPIALAIIWLITLVNIFNARSVGMLQLVTTIIKLLPFVLIICLGWRYFHLNAVIAAPNLSHHSDLSALTSALTLTFWIFVGLESATIPREIAENPRRNVPLATIIGVLVVIGVCVLANLMLMGMLPASALLNTTSPLADAAIMLVGHWGGMLVVVGAAVASLGVLNGWTLIQGQLAMAAADNRIFPAIFGRRNRYGSPYWGVITCGALTSLCLLITTDPDFITQFNNLLRLAILAFILPYFQVCLTLLFLLLQAPKKLRVLVGSMISLLALLGIVWIIIGCGATVNSFGMFLLVMASPLYILMRLQKSNILPK